jgi:diguanylate cyclase (GGDEF)-like protein
MDAAETRWIGYNLAVLTQASRFCRVAILSRQRGADALRRELTERSATNPWMQVLESTDKPSFPSGETVLVLSDRDAEEHWPWVQDWATYTEKLELPSDLAIQNLGLIAEWVVRFGKVVQERTSLRRLIDRFEERIKKDSARVRMADLLQEANHRLQEQVVRDGLTGIPNRRCFEEHFDFLWGRSAGDQTPMALIFCDIDHFKKLNDTLGHQEGDRALRLVASRLESLVEGADDLVARYGGEEFVIVLYDCDREKATDVAERLRIGVKALEIPHPQHAAGVVTISLGVACDIPSLMSSAEDFLHLADTMLYEAKSGGRDCWRMAPSTSA